MSDGISFVGVVEPQPYDQLDAVDNSKDRRLALMAECVVRQQRNGFKNRIDLRECRCPSCGGAGFNTGSGYWKFVCGAEILSSDDGRFDEPCGEYAGEEAA